MFDQASVLFAVPMDSVTLEVFYLCEAPCGGARSVHHTGGCHSAAPGWVTQAVDVATLWLPGLECALCLLSLPRPFCLLTSLPLVKNSAASTLRIGLMWM